MLAVAVKTTTLSLILREQLRECCPALRLALFKKYETNLLCAHFEMIMKQSCISWFEVYTRPEKVFFVGTRFKEMSQLV